MRNENRNLLYEKSIKNLKDTIDLLKKENNKLRNDNKEIFRLKELIKKLKKEKLEMSQRIIDYESESFLYNSQREDKDDILLYNPNNSNKKLKMNLKKFNFSFSINGIKNETNKYNKNDEISILKRELNEKNEIITLLKSNKKKYKPVIINNFSINSSSSTSNINSINSSAQKYVTFKNDKKNSINYNSILSNQMKSKLSNKISSTFSWKDENSHKKKFKKSVNDTPSEDRESHNSLEKNIFKEIENILEERKNFIIKTLVRENFSFDILSNKEKLKNNDLNENSNYDIKGMEDIDQLIEIIKNRKIKVQKTKKYFEEIFI
jgi:hypothetical protein